MSIQDDVLELNEVIAEFVSVGETIADLSLIRLEFVNDVHWQDLEATLFIFGAGDPDKDCPVLEIRLDPEALLSEDHQSQGISAQKFSALFEEKLKETVKLMKVPVVSNQGDSTEQLIDLSKPGDGILFSNPFFYFIQIFIYDFYFTFVEIT